MAAFDWQDEEDDFNRVDQGSRAEIADVTREIYQTIRDLSCLVIFHNGSDNTIDIADFGFPRHDWFSNRPNKVLWTFRGRLRLNPQIKENVDNSHLYIYSSLWWGFDQDTGQLILDEATEVVKYTQHKQSINPEIAAKCISYLLWFNKKGGGTTDYNWDTHASNYWVCDGIIDGQFDEPWDACTALQQQIQMEDCSSHAINFLDDKYTEHWKSVTTNVSEHGGRTDIIVSPRLTSFFLTPENGLYISLPPEMFQQSERLRVLRLSRCNFSFYAPPFCCCHSLRFLGLDHCKDQQQEQGDKQGRPVMEFFRRLWVLDISHMDWELNLSQDIIEQMAINIREVHVKKGRLWHNNLLLWRPLRNLRKLRVIEPTCSWETGKKDEFIDMVKLEILHLSGDSSIQVLPSLSTTTRLKTLVLDRCVGLEHIGPKGIPPSLESFSFVAGSNPKDAAKVSSINLANCVNLERFLLRGAFPALDELNLSRTSIRKVDLNHQVVQVPGLKRLFLRGCKFLDISGNSTIQVLSSLSGAADLKTLILDGCVGLENLDPQKFPQSLESFILEARVAKFSHISLAGCARLVNFRLRGSFPVLEQVDLSRTAIKMLDLTMVAALKGIFLVGCKQLCSIFWPAKGMQQLRLICIDTRGEEIARNAPHDSLVSLEQEKYCRAFVSITDMSFLQSLVVTSGDEFCWSTAEFKVNICLSSGTSKDDGRKHNQETMDPRSTARVTTYPDVAMRTYKDVPMNNYKDVTVSKKASDHSKNKAAQSQNLGCHMEIGEGISRTDLRSTRGTEAIIFVMNRVQSLHVHDNSSMTTVIPEHMMSAGEAEIRWHSLKWCHVERCSKLDTVFNTNYDAFCFEELEDIWVADLLMARSVWRRGRATKYMDHESFANLQSINVHFCPRLKFILPLSWFCLYTLSNLHTIHIVWCGDLKHIFPVETEFLNQIATEHRNGMLEFPRLKDLYLDNLSSLQQICEAKMLAPKLKTVFLNGCWGLRRLPATDRNRRDGHLVVVNCEKDWWDNLEWDGLDVDHHPSLFAPRHSPYYKKRHLRGTVLR